MPGFLKYKVTAGDYIYPVRVQKGTMYILGCMRVKVIQTIEEYVQDRPETFGPYEKSAPGLAFHYWMEDHRDQQYLCPSCCSEAALGDEATEIGLDTPVPPETITNLRFRSGKVERPIKHVTDGMITSVISISGHTLRLNDASAEAFAELCEGRFNQQ